MTSDYAEIEVNHYLSRVNVLSQLNLLQTSEHIPGSARERRIIREELTGKGIKTQWMSMNWAKTAGDWYLVVHGGDLGKLKGQNVVGPKQKSFGIWKTFDEVNGEYPHQQDIQIVSDATLTS